MVNNRKLPIGIQDFESLRTDGYLYVDKTAFVYRLATEGKSYFLGRPLKNTRIQCWYVYNTSWRFYDKYEKGDARLESLMGEFIYTPDGETEPVLPVSATAGKDTFRDFILDERGREFY